MKYIFSLLVLVPLSAIFAQKKIIDYHAYAQWKTIPDYQISNNVDYFTYMVKPYEGNNTVYLLKLGNNIDTLRKITRGSNPKINSSGTFLVATIKPDYQKVRQLEIKQTKKAKMPKDSIVVYDFASKKNILLPNIEQYEILDSLNLIVGQFTHDFKVNKLEKISKSKERKLKEGYESGNKTFFIFDPKQGVLYQDSKVESYSVDETQNFALLKQRIEKKKSKYYTISKIDLKTFKGVESEQKFESIDKIYASSKNNIIFLIGKLFGSKQKRNAIYQLSLNLDSLDALDIQKLLDTNYIISPSSDFIRLNQTEKWLVDIQRFKPEEPKDTLLKDEQVHLDIWSWKDAKLQPEQLLEAKRYYTEKFTTLLDLDKKQLMPIENDTLFIYEHFKDASYALATSSIQYDTVRSFDYPWRENVYKLNIQTGGKELILKRNFGPVILTPDGKWLYYQREQDTNMYVRQADDIEGIGTCITCDVHERWVEDLNGMDYIPSMDGEMMLDANKTDLWFNSTKALYHYNIKDQKLTRITPKDWLKRNIKLDYNKITSDSSYFNADNMIISVFDRETSNNAYYRLDSNLKTVEILSGYFEASTFLKKGNEFLTRIKSNELYPDFNIIKKGETTRITNINPQQSEYNWSKVEPIRWTSYDGQLLNGLLYRPENYDNTKKYPMIVYYYENYSEEIHRYSAPRPTASIIFPTEYASSGYFVLMPDIKYKIGHPAKGAYDAIMSATDYVLKKYPAIDSTRMGLQGQSWGGYETAILVTMTSRYRAAMAGAPVSNMFSAYGGIRWGSGISREFQYEHSQSRIGNTIWKAPELYIENSPLFHLPNVTTPLLIMHNDDDGAVPWYQGIEMYMGLRRLNKPVWLLNYNGDKHNLMKKGNRKDLSRRMKQFFDFYLNEGAQPEWIQKGIPAYEKGKNFGW